MNDVVARRRGERSPRTRRGARTHSASSPLAGISPGAVAALVVLGVLIGARPLHAGDSARPAGSRRHRALRGVEDRLLIVGDHEPGVYYSIRLKDVRTIPATTGIRLQLSPDRLRRHTLDAGPYAIDLESIAQLGDGRIVILSERLSALFDREGFVAVYDQWLPEFGGRGFEGLAVRKLAAGRSRLAVLWEGGYPEPSGIPAAVRELVCGTAVRPVVVIHELEAKAKNVLRFPPEATVAVELQVPLPPGSEPTAQRFRAPDLVWYEGERNGRDELGFLVLLSSGWASQPESGSAEACPKSGPGGPHRWCYKWLQRFTLTGERWGEPLDLEEVFPEPVRHSNWEGMGWFEPGESLVFVYDEHLDELAIEPQEAFVMRLPSGW